MTSGAPEERPALGLDPGPCAGRSLCRRPAGGWLPGGLEGPRVAANPALSYTGHYLKQVLWGGFKGPGRQGAAHWAEDAEAEGRRVMQLLRN